MFPLWVFVAVAALIAALAFAIGQVFPGFGVAFVALASSLWTVYAATRARRR